MDNMTRGKVGIAFLDRRAVLLSAFGLVGFGALVGVGSVYILYMKKRLKEHFLIQSTLQSQINELRNDIESLRVKLGIEDTPVVKPALKRRKKNSVRVTFLEGTKSDVEDDEYVTASSSSNSEYDEDAVVVFRNRKKFGTDLEANTTEAGDHAREGENSEIQEFVSKIDKLFEGSMSDHHEAYVTLKTNQDSLANSYAFWWRFAKATHLEAGLAAQQKDKELQKSLLENASSYAQRALELNEDSADAHKWLAISTGSRGEFLKINEKIQNGYLFKEHIDRAVQINPADASLYHLLGRFCFEVSQLSWVERRVASTLFSEPPSSTVEEALQHFLSAENKGKPFIENRLFISKCYISLSDYPKAAHWLTLASQLSAMTSNDEKAQVEVLELLPKYRKYISP